MAEAVGAAIITGLESIFFGGEWVFTASQIAAAGNVAIAAATFGYSANQKRRAQRRAINAYNRSLRDRKITVRGTLEERELVMGRVHKGGFFYPVGTTGDDSETFTFIVVMAGHSISAVNANYFDDNQLTLDGDGWVTSAPYVTARKRSGTANITLSAGAGTVTLPNTPLAGSAVVTFNLGGDNGSASTAGTISGNNVSVSGFGSYTGTGVVQYQWEETTKYARVRWMMGSESQTARADLISDFPSLWTSNHRLRGCAYVRIDLLYSTDVFPSGVPNFSADLNGANTVYDPRDASTGYSENPALLARWYALHPLGGRRSADQIDGDSFIAAANVCDTSANYGSGTTDLYKAGYVARAGQQPAEVLDELTEAMAGRWGYSQGKIRVRAGAVGATVASIDSTWLLDRRISVTPRRSRTELRNALQGSFTDEANNFQTLDFTRVVDAPAVAEDGVELAGDVEFAAIYRNGQCQQVAACMLRYERQALTITLNLKMRAFPLQLFDVVALTLPDLGIPDGKLFEVLERRFALGEGMSFTLKEIDDSIFEVGTEFPTIDPAPNTSLPNPRSVVTVGALTVASGTGILLDGTATARTTVSWAALADAGVNQGGFVEVAYLDASQSAEQFQIVRADTLTSHTLFGLRNGYHYLFKARGVNGVGVRGDWSASVVHKVSGPRGINTYSQTSAPTGSTLQAGDVWFDTDDGNKPYRYSGSAWVSVQDASIAAALLAANDAQATADGKIDTFWQASAPGSAGEGDIWFDTDDGYKQYRRTSGVWVLAADTRIGQAITAASDAQATADGKVVTFIQASAPTAEAVGDLWLDSDDGNKLYRWSGSAWVAVPLGTGALGLGAATEVEDFYDATGVAYSNYA